MSHYNKLAALAMCVLPVPFAMADSASERLTKIESETLILKAKEKQLDVQAKIIARQSEINTRQIEAGRMALPASNGNPVIVALEGIGQRMVASLQTDNGHVVDVRVGDVLANGMRVHSIQANEVIVENTKKQRLRLAIAGSSSIAMQTEPAYQAAGLRLPPPPPLSQASIGVLK
ncbi:MAG: type IV pilus biogenesis protein PilP [Undibacterium umbellatum]|uniref:type IV pilus biogenesis protein PilP n=1 Tax=Undibacterium umbellatum TaxID=2762300 RepID=UPI003BB70A61